MSLEKTAYFLRGLERECVPGGEMCSWCGQRPKRLFLYYTEGRRLLSGLLGEGKPFCNIQCFKSYQ